MKLVSYCTGGRATYGGLADGGLVDLGARFGARFPTLRDAIAAGALGELAAALKGAAHDHVLTGVELAIPIPNPEKIICVGVNYANRNEEYKDGSERPKYPSLFYRSARSFAA